MSPSAGNPFESTQPARKYFVGRADELAKLRVYLSTVAQGGATNLFIFGTAGGGEGKTSFLYQTVEEASQQGLVANVVTVVERITTDKLIYELVEKTLVAVAKRHNRSEYLKDFRGKGKTSSFRIPAALAAGEPVTATDIEEDLLFLSHICDQLSAKGVVFCIDEGQLLEHLDGGELFAKLRAAIQSVGKGFMIVLAALHDIIPVIAEGYKGVDRFFPNTIELGPFEEDNVAIAAIERRLQGKPIAFSREISETVVKLAERHPKDIIAICHDIYDAATTSGAKEASVAMISTVVYQRYTDEVKLVLESMQGLNPSHYSTLRKALRHDGWFTAKEIAELYSRGQEEEEFISEMEPRVREELRFLVDKKLCRLDQRENSESFRLASSRFAFILQNELGQVTHRQEEAP